MRRLPWRSVDADQHVRRPGVGACYRNLRLVRAAVLEEYLTNTNIFRSVGNDSFADYLRRQAKGKNGEKTCLPDGRGSVLYHSWLPGFVHVSEGDLETSRSVVTHQHLAGPSPGASKLLERLDTMGWCDDLPLDLDALVVRCIDLFAAIQNRYELRAFLEIVRDKKPQVILEIGTARGGVLYGLSQLANDHALLVSIDLPHARNGGGQTSQERELFASFGPPTQVFRFIPGNSLSCVTKESLRRVLGGRVIDVIFIDGEHLYGAVRSDFEMYQEFLSTEGIIALHDIVLTPDEWGAGNEVGIYWSELSSVYKSLAIIDPQGSLSRRKQSSAEWAWGIGIVRKSDLRKSISVENLKEKPPCVDGSFLTDAIGTANNRCVRDKNQND